ncbi:hypothetical protein [Gemelliphila palaticanis]|uniref:Pilus assembly protein CpaB n=1 Tax=Gemelliphila palaticanis TaxID=81950 RepID=A0ABX2SZ86_9BACL|nr:hypothetical protein [Gemella palaticanis]MBF0715458.1 hypothetical protein [Gemella palaticanis]NYS47388.1 hypothetical protein [Gemella palaticanis]
MKLYNKISIIVLLVSAATIAFSLYYYNEKYYVNAKNTATIKKEKKENIKDEIKEEISEKNIEIKTELKDSKYLVINIKNISSKDLIDVLLEANYNNIKLSDFYIESIKKDEEKIIELDINKKSITGSIIDLYSLNKPYILIENFDFTLNNIQTKIIVSSFKDQKIEDYKKLIDESDTSAEIKTSIINDISNIKDKAKLDNLLVENNIYSRIFLNPETIVFGADNKLVVNNPEQPIVQNATNQNNNVENNVANRNINNVPASPVVPTNPSNNINNNAGQPATPVAPALPNNNSNEAPTGN